MFATPQNRNWQSVLCQQLRAVQQITHPAKFAASYTTATNAMCYVCGKVKNTNHLLFYVCITVQYKEFTQFLMSQSPCRTAADKLSNDCSNV